MDMEFVFEAVPTVTEAASSPVPEGLDVGLAIGDDDGATVGAPDGRDEGEDDGVKYGAEVGFTGEKVGNREG